MPLALGSGTVLLMGGQMRLAHLQKTGAMTFAAPTSHLQGKTIRGFGERAGSPRGRERELASMRADASVPTLQQRGHGQAFSHSAYCVACFFGQGSTLSW